MKDIERLSILHVRLLTRLTNALDTLNNRESGVDVVTNELDFVEAEVALFAELMAVVAGGRCVNGLGCPLHSSQWHDVGARIRGIRETMPTASGERVVGDQLRLAFVDVLRCMKTSASCIAAIASIKKNCPHSLAPRSNPANR